MIAKNPGPILITFSIVTTLALYLISKQNPFSITSDIFRTLSQLFALEGLILLCISFFLSSRLKFVEQLFGGLDKVYKFHHLMGGVSFLLLLHHPIFLAVKNLPNFSTSFLYLFPGKILSYNLGIYALYLMIVLLFITFYVKLPYHIWKRTHDFMGLVIIIGGLHSLTIDSDISVFFPLKIWCLLFIALACVSFIYKKFFYKLLGPKFEYRLDEINYRSNQIIDLILTPITRPLKFTPGQFAFISFPSLKRFQESHPFSFSSNQNSDHLRFSIKQLGDYTSELSQLTPGSAVDVMGPYGEFYRKYTNAKSVICIGGGIGITPFVSMLSEKPSANVVLFYSVKTSSEAAFDADLKSLASQNNFTYYLHSTDTDSRINANHIASKAPLTPDTYIFICGPLAMMENLRNQFLKLKVKNSHIVFEDFNFL